MIVSGKVTDNLGRPVYMAVISDDRGNVTHTDENGNYWIESFLGANLTADYRAIGYGGFDTVQIDSPEIDFPNLFQVPEFEVTNPQQVVAKKQMKSLDWILWIAIILLIIQLIRKFG